MYTILHVVSRGDGRAGQDVLVPLWVQIVVDDERAAGDNPAAQDTHVGVALAARERLDVLEIASPLEAAVLISAVVDRTVDGRTGSAGHRWGRCMTQRR